MLHKIDLQGQNVTGKFLLEKFLFYRVIFGYNSVLLWGDVQPSILKNSPVCDRNVLIRKYLLPYSSCKNLYHPKFQNFFAQILRIFQRIIPWLPLILLWWESIDIPTVLCLSEIGMSNPNLITLVSCIESVLPTSGSFYRNMSLLITANFFLCTMINFWTFRTIALVLG